MTDKLRLLFLESFEVFLAEEADNILNGTSERNLCGRLAQIIERLARDAGFDRYRADVEYNRNMNGKIKTILDDNLQTVSITCDIILHSRGVIANKDNLIAIEMKRVEHPVAEKQKDRARLRSLTKQSYDGVWSADGQTFPEHVCGYELGYFVELDATARTFRLEEYVAGALCDRLELTF